MGHWSEAHARTIVFYIEIHQIFWFCDFVIVERNGYQFSVTEVATTLNAGFVFQVDSEVEKSWAGEGVGPYLVSNFQRELREELECSDLEGSWLFVGEVGGRFCASAF